jgi:hypothetical protein
MRQLATTLVLALSVIGCGFTRPDVGLHQDLLDLKDCFPETFIVGQLVADSTIAIQDDRGVITSLIWPSSYSLRWSPGFLTGQFEVLDDTGTLVAATGRRYRISGADFPAAGGFWACADVIPL